VTPIQGHAQTVQVFPPQTLYFPAGIQGGGKWGSLYVNAQQCTFPLGGWCPPPSGGVDVYTSAAVDSQMANLKAQDTASITSQVSAAQNQIETDLKAALDKLPQTLLTDAAKAVLEQRVIADLKPQLDSLQQQIDGLTQQINALKQSAETTSTQPTINAARAERFHRPTPARRLRRMGLILRSAAPSKLTQ
jgi:hypothetical protein